MAELMGKATGVCKGRGGSMHLADNSVGIIGESAIVGGGIPLATGVGLAAKVRRSGEVCLCFFGDGAVNQGTFHESLNMASLWKLPVIYLCENNGYAITTSLAKSHAQPRIVKRAESYAMPGLCVDGQDLLAVHSATAEGVARARRGEGPTLVEAQTYRFDEHEVGLIVPGEPYRSEKEVQEQVARRDPVALFRDALLSTGMSDGDLKRIEDEVEASIAQAIEFAEQSAYPDPSTLYDYLYSNPITEGAFG
jgi:pyruvate dehydrogenase E1 component alpha subunit